MKHIHFWALTIYLYIDIGYNKWQFQASQTPAMKIWATLNIESAKIWVFIRIQKLNMDFHGLQNSAFKGCDISCCLFMLNYETNLTQHFFQAKAKKKSFGSRPSDFQNLVLWRGFLFLFFRDWFIGDCTCVVYWITRFI